MRGLKTTHLVFACTHSAGPLIIFVQMNNKKVSLALNFFQKLTPLALGSLLLTGAMAVPAQETGLNSADAVGWVGEVERRLHTTIGDLEKDALPDEGSKLSKSPTHWRSHFIRVGEWEGRTVFQVVNGRVKRVEQQATAPLPFCDPVSDWGMLGQQLTHALAVDPMVYAPMDLSGTRQQAALWHRKPQTVVVYRTLNPEGECQVRVTMQ